MFPFIPIVILILYFKTIFSDANQTNINNVFQTPKNHEKFLLDCKFCNQKNFISSSHYKLCDKYILYRDHHCQVVLNCIGLSNMQLFVNFCFCGLYGLLTYNISCLEFFLVQIFIKLIPLH